MIASKAAADAADSGGDQQGAEHSVVAYYKLPEGGSSAEDVPAGIPEFWSHCMRSNDVLMEKITEKDEDVLRYLTDIRYELLGNDATDSVGGGGTVISTLQPVSLGSGVTAVEAISPPI